MNEHIDEKQNRDIVVVMRGASAVCFRKGEFLRITDMPTSFGPVQIVLTTRWIKQENKDMPGNLWIEITGKAPNLEEALVPFANAGLRLLPTLSLSANAAIGLPDIEIGFDNTPGVAERDYFQNYIPEERNVLNTGRFVNILASKSLFSAIDTNPESERLGRASAQYRLALNHWRLGQESLVISHFWMVLEALTKSKIRKECKLRGLDDQKQLADNLSIEISKLDSHIRKEFLLNGDSECYSKAKKASDGVEHGFLDYRKIRNLSQDIRHRMASHIRKSIFELCDLDDDSYKTLTAEPFEKPLGHWPVVKYLRGKLVGGKNQLAAKGNMYPFMNWTTKVKDISMKANGEVDMTFTDTLKPQFGDGIKFQPSSHEVWKPD
jgi:hypothetical protein